MFSRIRKRITYANVAMTLALVFAMSGGAFAASKYIINSTKQINPKVIKALKGKNGANGTNGTNGTNGVNGKDGSNGVTGAAGATGATGAKGTTGATGETGVTGATGPVTGELPSKVTLKGQWGVSEYEATEILDLVPISFGLSLASAPTPNYINGAGVAKVGSLANCTGGTAAEPKANPGNLCIWVTAEGGVTNEEPYQKAVVSSKFGAHFAFYATKSFVRAFGTWAVTG
jgi:hypothetical protein